MRVSILNKYLLLAVLAFACVCRAGGHSSRSEVRGYAEKSDKNVEIPLSLVEIINNNYIEKFREKNPESEETDAQLKVNLSRQFLNFNVHLFQQESHAAMGKDYIFPFPRGGGVIDLKDYIIGEKGSFYLKVDISSEELTKDDLKELKVFFISNAKERLVDGRNFGGGCNIYVDITKFFNQHILHGDGLKINATAQRYLSVIGGTFFLSLLKGGELFLASLSFEDSRYPELLCKL